MILLKKQMPKYIYKIVTGGLSIGLVYGLGYKFDKQYVKNKLTIIDNKLIIPKKDYPIIYFIKYFLETDKESEYLLFKC